MKRLLFFFKETSLSILNHLYSDIQESLKRECKQIYILLSLSSEELSLRGICYSVLEVAIAQSTFFLLLKDDGVSFVSSFFV